MSLLCIIAFYFAGKIIPRINDIVEPPAHNLIALLYSDSNLFIMKYNLPLWFLPGFFMAEIYGFITEKIERDAGRQNYVRVGVVIASILASAFLKIYLPWHIETAISMLFWFELGVFIRSLLRRYNDVNERHGHNLVEKLVIPIDLIGRRGITFQNIHNVVVRRDAYGRYGIIM